MNGWPPHIRAGKLKALGVGSEKRYPFLPDVPTNSEALPGFFSVAWFGLVAPPRTPPEIVNLLSAAIADILKQPDAAKTLTDMGASPYGSTPGELAVFMRQEAERWGNVILAAGVKAD